MTAATARVPITKMGDQALPRRMRGLVEATEVVKRGYLMLRDSGGYCVVATEAPNLTSAGIAEQDYDNTNGADGAAIIDLYVGVVALKIGASSDALTIADIGSPVYAMDNQTVGKRKIVSTTVRSAAGILIDLDEEDSTRCFVWVGPAASGVANGLEENLQVGTGTLSSGVLTVGGASGTITITASSKVFAQVNTPAGTMGTAGVVVKDADLTVGGPGTGAFIVRSLDDAGTAAASDTSTVNWMIVN
jgi:hypothetical protein